MPSETETETSSYELPATPESPSLGAAPLSQAPVQSPDRENASNFSQELQKENGSFQSETVLLDAENSQDTRKDGDDAGTQDFDDELGTQSLQETPSEVRNDSYLNLPEGDDVSLLDYTTRDALTSQCSTSNTLVSRTPDAHCHDFDECDDDQDGGLTDDQLGVKQPITQAFDPGNDCEATNEIHCAQDDIADDVDDDSESDDSSSSSEASPVVLEGLTEARERKVARNQTMMKQLGLIPSVKPKKPKRPHGKASKESVKGDGVGVAEGCMLWPGTMHSDIDSQDVYLKYPGREPQIRLVKSILHSTSAQLDGEETYVPPPIFITGPGGTCKTSIIRDIVRSVCTPRIASAYVNCATLEPSSIEMLVESAYQQIARTFEKDKNDNTDQERETSQLNASSLSTMGFSVELDCNETVDGDLEERVEQARSQLCPPDDNGELEQIAGKGSPTGAQREHILPSDFQLDGYRTTEDDDVRSSDTRRADDRKIDVARAGQKLNVRTRYSRQSKATDPGSRPMQRQDRLSLSSRDDARPSVSASYHGAPLAFARSLMPFIGERGVGSAFLILDCAERLMKFSPNRTSATKTNFLAQLLLLPKVMELKLAIIVISRSTLLLHSRIDNAAPVDRSIASIKMSLRPICFHFPAYSDNAAFEAILRMPDNLSSLTGAIPDSPFHRALVTSFVSSLVQAMRSVTRDVRDMLRVGCQIWPPFIEPLSAQNIESTLKAAESFGEDQDKALLLYMGRRMVKLSKNMENILFSLGEGGGPKDPVSDLPYLWKCMVLASFICQHNKADKDRQLFTITGNGKRRRQNQYQDDGDPESAAFASWDQQRLRMLRPRSFPLERMLTIFVSIVGLHEQRQLGLVDETTESFISSLGNSVFLETVGQLRATGLLRELPREGGLPMSAAMYYCEIGRDDAESVARSIDFPLERYLV